MSVRLKGRCPNSQREKEQGQIQVLRQLLDMVGAYRMAHVQQCVHDQDIVVAADYQAEHAG